MTTTQEHVKKYDEFVEKMDKAGFIKFLETLTKEQEEKLALALGERKYNNATA